MMPPISGIQAIAAATFEGKPVDVGFAPVSGSGLGEGGGGLGSSSGMIYIHKIENPLSSNLAAGCFFLLSIFGRSQYRGARLKRPMAKHRFRAFTLLEMIVVLGVIAIMMSLTYPVYITISQRARATQDLNGLRQVGLGMQTYLNDKDGILPVINALPGTGTNASPVIYPKYLASRKIFKSPFDRRPATETDSAPVSYGINQNMYDLINANMARVVSPSSTILMAPNYNGNPALTTSWTGIAAAAPFVPNLQPGGGAGMTTGPQSNGRQINALFCDLHVETMQFGPATTVGTFKDTTSNPLGLKHWNPTQ